MVKATKDRSELANEAAKGLACAFRSIKHSYGLGFALMRNPHFELISKLMDSKDGVSIKEIAKTMNVTSGAVTHFTDHLVARGFIIRKHDKKDKRVVRVELTPQARKKISSIRTIRSQKVLEFFEALSNEELSDLTKLLNKLN